MKFTDTMIKNLKPEAGKKSYKREGDGFAICVYPTGVKSWFFIYTMDGKRQSMSLGSYPDVTLLKAREKYNAAWKLYIDGKNPAQIVADTKEGRKKAPTVSDLITDYIEKHAKEFKTSWKEDERVLNKEVLPVLGKRKVVDIVKTDIIAINDSIIKRGSPGSANNSFQVIRKMFNFAFERDVIPFSPCLGVKLPGGKKKVRKRYLTESEINLFWNNLVNCSMSKEIRNALKLILLTAQRPGEVMGMHTKEIDGKWWTIPEERSKNGEVQRVPLSGKALEIIQETIAHVKFTRDIAEETEYTGYIFPCPHTKKLVAIERHALAVATNRNLKCPVLDDNKEPVLDKQKKPVIVNKFGIDHFTPHDLRRTAATHMSKQGQTNEVIDAILNHTKKGSAVIATYNQNPYDKEKQIALDVSGSVEM